MDSFWAGVRVMWERLDAQKKPGQAARVKVHLRDGESFSPWVISPEPPWLVFQTTKGTRVVAVQSDFITKVEIELVSADKAPPGFSVAERPEDIPDDGPSTS